MIIDSPIVSGSQFISGSSTQVGNAVISGSLTVTGAINATITGSITSASFANTSISASYALTASYISGSGSGTGFPFSGSASITGSLIVTDQIESQIFITPQTLSRDIRVPDYHNALILGPSNITGNITIGTGSNVIVIEDFTNLATTGSNTFVGNQAVSGSITATAGFTGSLLGNASTSISASNSNTASFAFTASQASNADLLDGRDSTTFAGTGSNQFTGSQYISDITNATSFISTAALYTDGGLRVAKDAYVSGTVYVNNLTVYGTSSIQYTTSSQVDIGANIITVNTATPAIRFGGYAVFDSGSTGTGLTGSLLWDSEKNRWVYSNPSGSEYDGGILISGPKNSSGLGNEQSLAANYITKGQGGDHITASQIFDNGTTVSIPGNLTVTGSITGTVTNAITASYSVSSSLAANAISASFAQTASYLLNVVPTFPYTGSAIISGSLQVTGSLNVSDEIISQIFITPQTLSRDIVVPDYHNALILGPSNIEGNIVVGTGSNVIVIEDFTNLATTGSNTFVGSQTISGSVTATTGFTGSLLGNASTATSASYALTASFVATAQTASYVLQAVSSSFALTASYVSGSGAGVGFPFSGSAVITGSLLITSLSSSGVTYVTADANGLLVAQTASAAITSTQTTFATAGQTVYPISGGYTTGLVNVFVNGTKLNSTEYTDTSGTNIVLATGSFSGDVVEFQKYFPASGVTNNALRQVNYFTATAGQTIFSASYTPGLLDVFYNGSKLDNTEYIANSGNAITLATASAAGDKIEIDVYSYQVGSFSGIGGSASGSQLAYFNTANSITGSPNFTVSGSSIVVTGSLLVSGSGTFINIGPAVFSGSLTSTQGFTGSFSGIATSASFATTAITAFTASSIANLNQNVAITGSLTTTGQIVAQTLNVQQVTSSIVYSSGSNIFGSTLGNTQQMTGSVTVTGSFAVATTGTELQVTNTGVNLGNVLTDNHNVTGSLRITGSVTVFNYTSSLPSAAVMVSGSINAISAESKFAYGTWNDPSPGNIFDAKFGGTQNGIAVRGTSYFSGSVGIGTSSPSSILNVASAQSLVVVRSTTTTNYAEIQVENTTNYLQMGVEGATGNRMGGTIAYNAYLGSYNNYGMTFHTNNLNRMTITNSGNIGIGTTSPSALLTVAGTVSVGNTMTVGNQGGADTTVITGGSGFGSKINFNSPSGVAAQITGNTDSFVNRFTGNFGIGTISPTHKLDVSGNINIPGGNQIVFNNEPTVWALVARTTTSTPNLGSALKNMLYCGGGANEGFAILGSGYTAAFEINNSGNAWVRGTLTKGGGSFRIDHPLPEKKDTHYLYHSFIEGPKADLIYRGKINLINGIATVNIDEVSTMTEGTFELLTRDVQCFVNNISGWDLVRGNVVGNILTIESQNPNSTDEIGWMVVAERNDEWFRNSEMTDEDGNTIVEKLKPIIE